MMSAELEAAEADIARETGLEFFKYFTDEEMLERLRNPSPV
jgi:hypothetical protein